MKLQGMTDKAFETMLQETENIQYLIIVKLGKMATKTAVENVLMTRHGFDRSDAHTLTNCAESRNNKTWTRWGGKLTWALKRTEPALVDYPELEQ